MQDRHILIVEDDPKIRSLLRACFEGEGATVAEATDLKAATQAFAEQMPDLVTLDIGLDGDNGLDIARELRRTHDTPIIMVTGKADVIDRIVGLELGADDYITKPFHVREMLARANAVLRRYEGHTTDRAPVEGPPLADTDTLLLDGLRIDLGRMDVRDRNGDICGLTTGDFKLLRAFVEHAGRPLSRDRLMDLIDGPEWVPLDRTIDNQVARLRKKIERDARHPQLIKTVRGIGYMLTQAAQSDDQRSSSTA
ncbi:response regulator transcription factor [Rhodobacteraceae bacterium N5(2021)]|uniref:Response regulator transcription factor n=1 Tax=Gymnodinialimonas phycosphaerae TaxID=2841589 RepID=A0A975TS82_9RHOB|nr:response regulator transcription factor [Gymnodinialimonas phycosphaerae]MBY4893871.1 response regulator transcription factor [Gymnodinialimonas phycosphaerae]